MDLTLIQSPARAQAIANHSRLRAHITKVVANHNPGDRIETLL